MLVPNTDIWQTRIQNIDALLTARSASGSEAYYLATVCQVALDPPLVSVSPNPEYPICAAIEAHGSFGINFLAEDQSSVIARCIGLNRHEPDKIAALGLAREDSTAGTPLLRDCIQSLECRVEQVWDSGDHRTFVGRVVDRRSRPWTTRQPHRFGGGQRGPRNFLKKMLCWTGVVDLLELARGRTRPGLSLEQGTQTMLDEPISALGGVRTLLAPSPPGLCLVGCGWWGKVHALAMHQQGPTLRRFFASRDLQRARDFADRFGGQATFTGLAEALADARVHAVLLSLPHHLHGDAVRAALAAGKHVLVEKPLALTAADGEELVRLADAAGLCLAVAEEYRFSPLVHRAGELIRAGELGRISLVQTSGIGLYKPEQDWKNSRSAMGAGILLDLGIHHIDILRSWFGEPETVWATTPPQVNSRMEGEDGVVAVLRFPNGPVATVNLSWSAYRSADAANIEVMGERGSLRIWFNRPYLSMSAPLPPEHWSHAVRRRMPWRIENRLGKLLPRVKERRLPVPKGDLIGSRAMIEDFVRSITTGAEPGVPGQEGLADLKVVLDAYRCVAG